MSFNQEMSNCIVLSINYSLMVWIVRCLDVRGLPTRVLHRSWPHFNSISGSCSISCVTMRLLQNKHWDSLLRSKSIHYLFHECALVCSSLHDAYYTVGLASKSFIGCWLNNYFHCFSLRKLFVTLQSRICCSHVRYHWLPKQTSSWQWT